MVKRITDYQFTKKFKKEYQALPREIQDNFDKKTVFLFRKYVSSIHQSQADSGYKKQMGGIHHHEVSLHL